MSLHPSAGHEPYAHHVPPYSFHHTQAAPGPHPSFHGGPHRIASHPHIPYHPPRPEPPPTSAPSPPPPGFTSSPPSSSATHPAKRIRRTHARRSCLACRKRKARCELPDITVPSSMTPLETPLKCHRCRTLDADCVVWDGDRKTKGDRPPRYGPPQARSQSQNSARTQSASRPQASDSPHDPQPNTPTQPTNGADGPLPPTSTKRRLIEVHRSNFARATSASSSSSSDYDRSYYDAAADHHGYPRRDSDDHRTGKDEDHAGEGLAFWPHMVDPGVEEEVEQAQYQMQHLQVGVGGGGGLSRRPQVPPERLHPAPAESQGSVTYNRSLRRAKGHGVDVQSLEYRLKLIRAFGRNAAQACEIIYRCPEYKDRSLAAEMVVRVKLPPVIPDVRVERSKMEAFIFANPWISLNLLRAPEEDSYPPLIFLRRVVTYLCLRPHHPPELLAAVVQESCSHAIFQTRSREVCQAILLLAMYEPLDLRLAKPPEDVDQEFDHAPGSYLYLTAITLALSLNLDSAIFDMCSGPTALTPSSPWEERIARLQDASLWLAVSQTGLQNAWCSTKPVLPNPHPSQIDIEAFHTNVQPLLRRSAAQAMSAGGQDGEPWPTPDWISPDKRLKLAGSFLAMAHQAKFFHRIRTFWKEIDGYELHDFGNIGHISQCVCSLTRDTERLDQSQRDEFASLPTQAATPILLKFQEIERTDLVGSLLSRVIFAGVSAAGLRVGAVTKATCYQGLSQLPYEQAGDFVHLTHINAYLHEQNLARLGSLLDDFSPLAPSGLPSASARFGELEVRLLPPMAVCVAVFSAAKHMVERTVVLCYGLGYLPRRASNLVQRINKVIDLLVPFKREDELSIAALMVKVLCELSRRFQVFVESTAKNGKDRPAKNANDRVSETKSSGSSDTSRNPPPFYQTSPFARHWFSDVYVQTFTPDNRDLPSLDSILCAMSTYNERSQGRNAHALQSRSHVYAGASVEKAGPSSWERRSSAYEAGTASLARPRSSISPSDHSSSGYSHTPFTRPRDCTLSMPSVSSPSFGPGLAFASSPANSSLSMLPPSFTGSSDSSHQKRHHQHRHSYHTQFGPYSKNGHVQGLPPLSSTSPSSTSPTLHRNAGSFSVPPKHLQYVTFNVPSVPSDASTLPRPWSASDERSAISSSHRPSTSASIPSMRTLPPANPSGRTETGADPHSGTSPTPTQSPTPSSPGSSSTSPSASEGGSGQASVSASLPPSAPTSASSLHLPLDGPSHHRSTSSSQAQRADAYYTADKGRAGEPAYGRSGPHSGYDSAGEAEPAEDVDYIDPELLASLFGSSEMGDFIGVDLTLLFGVKPAAEGTTSSSPGAGAGAGASASTTA